MTSELFESRQDDFIQIRDEVRRRLLNQMPRYTGESQKQLCRELERSLEEALLLIQEMEAELRKAPTSYRTSMLPIIRGYKQDIEQLSREVKRATLSRTEASVPYAGFVDSDDFENAQRARLMQGTATLSRASDSLARSHQVAAETDQIADEIVNELGTQRESLERTRDHLHNTDTNLSRSRKILNSMMRKALTNKMLLAVIILLELAIFGVVIWWKFFKK